MLGQDRGRTGGGPDPVRPARGGNRPPGGGPPAAAVMCGRPRVPAGAGCPATGTLPRPADRADRPSSARTRRRWPWRTLVAAAGGLSAFLAFPGHDLLVLAVLGPAALALAVRGQRLRSGVWLGLVLGLAFFVPLLSWSGVYVGPLPWLALAGWEALHVALLGGATALTSRLPLWPLWAAALCVADEALRGRFVLGGFPWGRLGFSQTEGPILALAAYGGGPPGRFAGAPPRAPLAAPALPPGRPRRPAPGGRRPAGPAGPP